jgi:hypothetical protein
VHRHRYLARWDGELARGLHVSFAGWAAAIGLIVVLCPLDLFVSLPDPRARGRRAQRCHGLDLLSEPWRLLRRASRANRPVEKSTHRAAVPAAEPGPRDRPLPAGGLGKWDDHVATKLVLAIILMRCQTRSTPL